MKRVKYKSLNKTNSCGFILSPGKKTEVKCLFTELRVDRDSLPEGMYLYEIKGTDSGCIGNGIIREHVIVNFVGSLITKTKLKMTHTSITSCILPYRGVGSYSFVS